MGMTIDEAINHCEEIADECEYEATRYDMTDAYESHIACKQGSCGEEHRQLAEWLKDYKKLKKQEPTVKAIPVKQLEKMYEKFQKKLWSESEDVRGDDMIEIGLAEEFLQEFLMKFGCWDREASK